MKKSVKILLASTAGFLFLLTTTASAENLGDWTERFELKGGNWILHTPTYVNLDGWMQAGSGINIGGKSLNGTPLTSCGLHVKTNSTREQFVKSLVCSGLYPAT